MDAAIKTSLMLRTAFKLALHQTDGLMTSVLFLMGLTISAPDHSTVTRRAETLPVIQPATVPPGPLHEAVRLGDHESVTIPQGRQAGGQLASLRRRSRNLLSVDMADGASAPQLATLPL